MTAHFPSVNSLTQISALITGASGFVGSNLADRLVTKGWKLHLITRPGSDPQVLSEMPPDAELHPHDGSTAELIRIVRHAQPKIVFHLASYFRAEHKSEELVPMFQSNLVFSTQLLEAMAENGVRLLINTGTTWQNYENQPYRPVCLYAATKQAFEDLLQFYVDARDILAITLKLSDTYGPHDRRPKLLNVLTEIAKEGQHLPMSPGEQLIDIVHIEDVIDAFVLAAERLLAGKVSVKECYAVRANKAQPLKELVEHFLASRDLSADIGWGERPYRAREVMIPSTIDPVLPGWRQKRSIFEH